MEDIIFGFGYFVLGVLFTAIAVLAFTIVTMGIKTLVEKIK